MFFRRRRKITKNHFVARTRALPHVYVCVTQEGINVSFTMNFNKKSLFVTQTHTHTTLFRGGNINYTNEGRCSPESVSVKKEGCCLRRHCLWRFQVEWKIMRAQVTDAMKNIRRKQLKSWQNVNYIFIPHVGPLSAFHFSVNLESLIVISNYLPPSTITAD